MKWSTKQLTLCGVLTALALALSYMENLFPLTLAIPLPGVKLGLANIVTVFALYALGTAPAFLILIARCLLGAMFAGNMSALILAEQRHLFQVLRLSYLPLVLICRIISPRLLPPLIAQYILPLHTQTRHGKYPRGLSTMMEQLSQQSKNTVPMLIC